MRPQDGSGSLRAAFLYRTAIASDHCWAEAHEIARRAVAVELGAQAELLPVENVADAEVASAIERLIAEGTSVFYACSMSYGRAVASLAEQHPQVIFEVCQGSTVARNVGTYRAAVEESAYVSGIVAGSISGRARLGMVGATGGPNELAFLNAWARGVAVARPEALIAVRWTASWDDERAEVRAVDELADWGADVIGGALTENAAIPRAAARRGICCMTRNVDRRYLAPGAIYDVTLLDWRLHYSRSLQSVLSGTWTPRYRHYHYGSGVVGNAITQALAPEKGTALALAAARELSGGVSSLWDGEIRDNRGSVVVPAGSTLSAQYHGALLDGQTREEACLLSPQLNWLLENVVEDGPRP